MHGDSRHEPSRPRRANGRTAGAAGAGPGGLPDATALARLLEPVVHAAGMDLESVRVSPAGRRRLLKLVVDADGGAALDRIALVSREVSARLDASGAMGEVPYTLEVSSPGVDRPLTEPRHWRRAQGRLISAPLAGGDGDSSRDTAAPGQPQTIRGRVVVAGHTAVTLDVAGERHEFAYAELGPGQVQLEFGRAGEAGQAAEAGGAANAGGAAGAGQEGAAGAGRARARARGGSRDGH